MNNYFDTEDFKGLLQSYEEQVERGESPYFDADEFADLADYYLTNDKPVEARTVLDQGIAIHGNDDVLMSTLTGLCIFNHSFEEARNIITENELDGNDILYMQAQLTYAIDNDLDKAEKMFRKWLRKEMANAEEADKDEMERDSYLHVISSFVDLQPNSTNNDDDLAAIRRWIEEYIDRFAPLGKYDCDVQVAEICRNTNLADLLVKLLAPILEERPYMKNGWSSLALGYLSIDNFAQAIESADFALAIDPHDKEAMLARAYANHCLDDNKEACKWFDAYWHEDDIELAQGVVYGCCLSLAGEKEKAYEMAQIGEGALEREREAGLNTSDRLRKYIMAMNDTVNLYQELGKYEDCERCTRRIIEVEPDNGDNYMMLGNYIVARRDINAALDEYGKAVMRTEDKIGMMIEVGLFLVMNGYEQVALEILTGAEVANDKFQVNHDLAKNIHAIKALAYLKTGDSDSFLNYFKKAVDLTPDMVRYVFADLFPEGMQLEEYYDFVVDKVKEFREKALDGREPDNTFDSL